MSVPVDVSHIRQMWGRDLHCGEWLKNGSRKRSIRNHHPPGQNPDGNMLLDRLHHDFSGARHVKQTRSVNNEQAQQHPDFPAPLSGALRHAGDRNGQEGALHLSAASPSILSMQSVCFRFVPASHCPNSHSETAVPFQPNYVFP